MKPTSIFSSKAEKYARYRWRYAPEAVEALLTIAGAGPHATIADLGAGTGILTHALAGRAGRLLAIEPNPVMRAILVRDCAGLPGCAIYAATAEATGLPAHSLDLVAVGTAFNWFDPLPTRAELFRVLKPGGWLANLRNRTTGPDFGPDGNTLYPPQTDTGAIMKGAATPFAFYLNGAHSQRLVFPFELEEDWPHFFGSLASASFAPDDDHPAYAAFEQRARALFERLSQNGKIRLSGVTELEFGQVV